MTASLSACRLFIWAAALLVVLALPAMSEPAPPPTAASLPTPVKWTVNGYVQARISDTTGDHKPLVFDAKRLYITFRVDVDQHISAGALVSGSPVNPFNILEAYGEYRFNQDFKARAGEYRLPFGYELPLSSSRLITLERSQVVTAFLYKNFNFERGAYVYYAPPKLPYNISLGVVDGIPVDYATSSSSQSAKNVVARAGYNVPGGQIGISAYAGKGPQAQLLQRTGYDVETTFSDFTLLSEGIIGRGRVIPHSDRCDQ